MVAREKGRDGGGGFSITTPLPNEFISICEPPASSALFFRTPACWCVLRSARPPPLWIEMKKLAVGAENWSIDTFAPSVDLGITRSRFLLPRPQMGRTRIAEGLPKPRLAVGRNRRSFLPFPRLQFSHPHVPCFLPNSRFCLFVLPSR